MNIFEVIIGNIIFNSVGAFIRWIIKGRKRTYKEVLDGPKFEDPADSAAYHMTNNIIGAVTLVGLGLLLLWSGL